MGLECIATFAFVQLLDREGPGGDLHTRQMDLAGPGLCLTQMVLELPASKPCFFAIPQSRRYGCKWLVFQ
jgi:hypothetical protein